MYTTEDLYMVIEKQYEITASAKWPRAAKFVILEYNLPKKIAIIYANKYIDNTLAETGNDIKDNIFVVKHSYF